MLVRERRRKGEVGKELNRRRTTPDWISYKLEEEKLSRKLLQLSEHLNTLVMVLK